MDLRRQLSILRKWFLVLLASSVLAIVAAYVATGYLPRVYEAKAILIVGQALTSANPDYNQLLTSQRLSQTYAELATTRPILTAVASRVGLGVAPNVLRNQVTVEAPRDQSLLVISVQDTNAERAAAIVNALSEELIAASPALQGRESAFYEFIERDLLATQGQIEETQAEVERLLGVVGRSVAQEQQLATLQSRLVTLRSTYASLLTLTVNSSPGQLSVIEPGQADFSPVSPRPIFNMVIAGLLGLLVAIAIAFTVEHLDDTLKRREDVDEVLGLPTVGEIGRIQAGRRKPDFYRLVTLLYSRTPVAEAFRSLRTNLEFTSLDTTLRTIVVTSSVPQEGKTTVAANLAVVFAQAGRSTILVDADLRRPGVHRMFRVTNTSGLTDLLRSDAVDVQAVAHQTEVGNLLVLTTGPLAPNPAEILSSDRMAAVIERLKAAADLVIFDTPPIHAVTDAVVLAAQADGTVLVVRAGRTRSDVVRRSRDALGMVNARVLGVVLNQLRGRGAIGYDAYYGAAKVAVAGAATRKSPTEDVRGTSLSSLPKASEDAP